MKGHDAEWELIYSKDCRKLSDKRRPMADAVSRSSVNTQYAPYVQYLGIRWPRATDLIEIPRLSLPGRRRCIVGGVADEVGEHRSCIEALVQTHTVVVAGADDADKHLDGLGQGQNGVVLCG